LLVLPSAESILPLYLLLFALRSTFPPVIATVSARIRHADYEHDQYTDYFEGLIHHIFFLEASIISKPFAAFEVYADLISRISRFS
jgi:hypothetical protein